MFLWDQEPGREQHLTKLRSLFLRGTLKRGSVPQRSVWGEGAAPNQPPGKSVPFCSANICTGEMLYPVPHQVGAVTQPIGAGTKISREAVESGLEITAAAPPRHWAFANPLSIHPSPSKRSLSAQTEIFMVFPEEIARVHAAPPSGLAAKENSKKGKRGRDPSFTHS